MSRTPKPWYWNERQSWYVTLCKVRHNLGPDAKIARQKFHEMMSKPVETHVAITGTFVALIDQFLDWVEIHRSPDTYVWYQSLLQLFARRYPSLVVSELRPFHLQQWIDSCPDIKSGTKRNYCRAVQRCMRWAQEQGLIEKNPLAFFKKPRGGVRELVFDVAEYRKILKAIKRQPLKDLCTFAWETGARAIECLRIEKRHVDLANQRIVFPVDEEKTKRAPRVIYLTDAAAAIIRRLVVKSPEGPIFKNFDGNPWTADAVNCAFARLKERLKKKYCLTAFRHSFCHRLLRSGVDCLTVSVLMGHSDTTMISRVYSHLTQAPDYLLKALRA